MITDYLIIENSFITMVTKYCHYFWERHRRSSMSRETGTKEWTLPQFWWATHTKDQNIRRLSPRLNYWYTKHWKINLIKTSRALFQRSVGQFIKKWYLNTHQPDFPSFLVIFAKIRFKGLCVCIFPTFVLTGQFSWGGTCCLITIYCNLTSNPQIVSKFILW